MNNNLAFDIGANIGMWTDANLNNFDKIISIEASPSTFKKLKNKCKNNHENLENFAICDNNNNNIIFYEAEINTISTLNKYWLTNSNSRFCNNSYKEIVVKTKTIDNLIDKYGIPDLIKIDVEGGEYECIKSLTQKVNDISFEWASETNNITLKCLEHLLSLGYNKFYIQNGDNYTFRTDYMNYENILLIKQKLSKMTPRKDWGMIWCI